MEESQAKAQSFYDIALDALIAPTIEEIHTATNHSSHCFPA